MSGGIRFEITGTQLRDQFDCLVICTRCGGARFDVTLGLPDGDRVECANPLCGQPVIPAADSTPETKGDPAAGG